ncbi:mucin-2 [Struthio camelus]
MGLRVASLFMLWLVLSFASEIKQGRTRSHGHYVCSTWGNNHFKTFDGDIYQFPGVCEYNFASDCRDSYREFSVQIQRALNSNNHPVIQYILITVKDFTVYLTPKLAVVDGQIVKTPYYSSGVLIENNDIYTKVYAKLGLILIWNQEDALMVELDSKFNNYTCGLCGDYNGIPIYNEFISGVASYNSITYGNLQKISKPNSRCEDPDETQALPSCNEHRDECERLLTSSAFADCHSRLNVEMYVQACMQDKCACNGIEDSFCLCSTISEYSRQCSHAGGRPGEWRTQRFCPKTCPGNMIYRESSSPCMDTCSHLEISSLCEEHYMDGCFCPEGTVYDDITEKGCIPVSQCYCKLHGKGYSPGQSITSECEECTCDSGRWTCRDLPCPGICSVEGGSHITTFDGKKYTFHGDCYYMLAKGTANDSYALLAELSPCGFIDRQTCLKTVVLLVDHKKNVVVFRSDGSVLLNEMTVNVPHVSASFSIFKPSSYYLIVQTSFGLRLQIQLLPVMQLFATVSPSAKENVEGLCGNFNGIEGDDFKTASGLVEATGSAFANTWKAQSTCTDKLERLEDPCSLSIESASYAEHWCSLLKNPEGPFARCHLVVDPSEYYKKCKYDTCLCKDSEECLCAALSSYSRACAFKGIILGGWRQTVCTKEVSACPENQIFLYNLTMCQQTCRSVADGEKHCLQDFVPVDGCGCPDNTYLDNQKTCVPISKCPCYYKGSYLEPGDYVTKDEERCVCRNAKLQCTSVTVKTAECPPHKTYFDCNTFQNWTSQTPVQLSCHTPRTDHFQAECVSGCVCPQGLFDDGREGCVEEKDCPCVHNNQWYSHGDEITVDCKTCICQRGGWSCTKGGVCYGTCTIYGSGHYITFDGKFYDFDGSCEYVATQDFCGDKNSSSSFSIITENVPCGTTGVTCSKAIKMFLGNTELKLENKDYKEIQRDVGDEVHYRKRTVGLYLVIEASNGVMLIWDKKTTIFIKLTPDYKGKVCGLCGNFDGKSNNDFTTRSGLQETSALEFGNSWKQSYTCPDVTEEILPCSVKPHRKSWAEKECYLIRSAVFEICHSKVDPTPFYDACVHDACSCDSGGDCECFCSAVAAYAQECIKAKACVFWRTPDICPIFCDYYNPRNECEWHYEPCGSDILTCKMINNVSTNFSVPYLEGCYPRCPPEKPIYNEETKKCETRDDCGCYFNGTYYEPGKEIPTQENCTRCVCVSSGITNCTTVQGCPCVINGTRYEVGQFVGQKQEGDICIRYMCGENGSIVVESIHPCVTTHSPATTTTPVGTSTLTTVTSTSPPGTTTSCLGLICNWTKWYDVSKPEEDGGDYETYDAIRNEVGNEICEVPEEIECRAKHSPDTSLEELGQKVECNVTYGLICKNEEQSGIWTLCYNYEIRVSCCKWQEVPCGTTPSPAPPATSTTTSTTIVTTTTPWQPVITTTRKPTSPTASQSTPLSTTPVTSTTAASCDCIWTGWIDVSYPSLDEDGGDDESYENIQKHEPLWVCAKPENISCRAKKFPDNSIKDLGQKVECDINKGLTCRNKDQDIGGVIPMRVCLNYEISVCCIPNRPDCISSTISTTPTTSTTPSIITRIPPPPTSEPQKTQYTSTTITPSSTSMPTTRITEKPSTVSPTTTGPPLPPGSTSPPSVTTSGVTETGSTTEATTRGPTPSGTTSPTATIVATTTTGPPPTGSATTSTSSPTTISSETSSPLLLATTSPLLPPGSTSPPSVTTSGVTETGSTTEATTRGPTPSGTTSPTATIVATTTTGPPPTGSATTSTSSPTTISSETSSPLLPTTTGPSLPPGSTSPPSVTTSGVTETGSTTEATTRGPTPSGTTSPTATIVATTTTGPPPTGSATTSTSSPTTISSETSSPLLPTTTGPSLPPGSTSPPSVTTSGVTETGSTTEATTRGPTPSGTTSPTATIVATTTTGPPPTGSATTSTTSPTTISSETSSPLLPTTTGPSLPPGSTSPPSVTTSGVTETGSTTEATTRGPTPSGTTSPTATIVATTTTGPPPTGSATTSTTSPTTISSETSSPLLPTTTGPSLPPGSTSPPSVTTSGVTETGSTTEATTRGPTPSGTTSPTATIVATTTTGPPPTGSATTSTSSPTTISSETSSPLLPTTTGPSLPPGSTSPPSVTTSGVTETGSTTEATTRGPTPSGTTSPTATIVATTTTGPPPTGSATTSTTSPTTISSETSSPLLPTTTGPSLPPGSTSPPSVTTSGVTETGSTTEATTRGPTPSGTTSPTATIVATTTTGPPPTGSATTSTSSPTTISSETSSPLLPTTTGPSLPPGSTSPPSVTTSGVTETGSTTEATTRGPTPSGTTSPTATIVATTTTGPPPTGSATTSTTSPTTISSETSSPLLPTTTGPTLPPGSTSPPSVTTSGVTETGSTTEATTRGPTPSGTTSPTATIVATTTTGPPPTGSATTSTSSPTTISSETSSPLLPTTTGPSLPPGSTSPPSVTTSGVTETGSTTEATTRGPTPSGTTSPTATIVATTTTGPPPTGSATTSTSSPTTISSETSSPLLPTTTGPTLPPGSTSPPSVTTSGVTETGSTTEATTRGPTPSGTTSPTATIVATTTTGPPPTGSATTSTTSPTTISSETSSPLLPTTTGPSLPPGSTSPPSVTTSGVTETGSTTEATTRGPTPSGTTSPTATIVATTTTGPPPTGSATTSTTSPTTISSETSSPLLPTTTGPSLPPGSTSPPSVTTSGVTETGSTTEATTRGPTPSGTTSPTATIVATTTTGPPPTGSATTSTTSPTTISSETSSPLLPTTTGPSLPPGSTSPPSVTTSGVTETGSTTEATTRGPTPSGTTSPTATIVATTTTGPPPTGSATTSTSSPTTISSETSSPLLPTTTGPSLPPGSTSPPSVTTSGVTETGSTTEATTRGPTPSGTTSPTATIVATTTTGPPPTGSATTSTSSPTTISSETSSPLLPTTTGPSLPPGSTSPPSVTTSGVTETGSTTEATTRGPTPSGTTSPTATIVATTTTGPPPTGSATTSTSSPTTISSETSSPLLPTTTGPSLPPGSTSPPSVTTSGVTETGSTTEATTRGPTPSGTTSPTATIVATTTTGPPPTGSATTSTSSPTTISSETSSPLLPTTTGPSLPPGSTSPPSVTTSGVTETGSTTEATTRGPTPSGTTSPTATIVATTTTGPPPTGSATTSTTSPTTISSETSSPLLPTTTGPSLPPGSTSPPSVTTSGVTETGSTTEATTRGPTPSGTTSPTATIVATTTTGPPPTGSATTSTTSPTTISSETSSPLLLATTSPLLPPGSTSPPSVTTSGVTETGSTTEATTLGLSLTSIRTTPVSSTIPVATEVTSTVSATTSGTTPTESFTTTSGTTPTSSSTTPVTTTTSSPGSTSTSGPTTVSSTGSTSEVSTYNTFTTVRSTSAVPPTTPGKNCSIYPNQTFSSGDSWWICECLKAICIEDNKVKVIPVICNPPPKPTCTNGLAPVKVIDKDGCCWHWECDCYCTGWGDPHYVTFDGLYYSYQGNCTYVLVEEINKSVDNFGVYIDNYHCNAHDAVSCPRTLIVRHETQEVRIATVQPNSLKVEVTVNKQAVALPYKKFGLTVYESGINRVVEIPELKMNVTYNGLSFSIRMPYSLFGNNTQGQCGTCNNNTADDCMLPNGSIAENCETMADHWQVVDPSKPQCSSVVVPTKVPSTTTGQPCKESSICQLLLGSVFEKCHKFIHPEKYYAACVFDSCTLPQLDLECSSLQVYAATCADQGICIDWRTHTNGVCSYKCPAHKEYRACGPIKELTCKSSPEQQNQTETKEAEGCFCPNGTMLHDSGVDVCVKTCGCVGLDNIPREYGEKFTVDCKDCICLEGGSGIVCEAHKCAEQNKISCDGEGFYKVTEVNSEDPCCPIITCKCNTSLCTTKPPKCELGFEVYSHIPSGQCCPAYQCVSKRVCVHQNAEFLPNSSVFVDKCQNCFCTNEVNVTTQLNVISCEHVPCDTYCEPGYERQPVKGECCGKCVQTKCVIHTSKSSVLILSPGEFKNDPYNNCTIYSCVNIHNQLISSTSEITCPAFNEENCKPGTVTFLPNGCCKKCAPLDSPTPCSVRQRKDFIVYQGCHSLTRVDLTECEGTCGTFSLYSAEANSMEHSCSCCREARTSVREVELKCPTGHSLRHKYVYVESCSCQDTECDISKSISKSKESTSTEENDKESALNRIKRAISLTSK